MKPLPLLFFLIAALPRITPAEPEFRFETGPEWRGERIELPPGFAPDLGWNGVEVIRFAPGMFQPESDSFFSYALVFLLEAGSDVSREAIQREVLTYYRGLATAVMGGKGIPVDAGAFTLDMEEDSDTVLRATLDWIEPFATRQAQTLHLEIHPWMHGQQPAIFFAVSPQPEDHVIWTELRRIQESFRFEE